MVIVYQNDKTGAFASHKERFRPSDTLLRQLIAELERDTGLLSLWIDVDRAQWFSFEKAGVFRDLASEDAPQFSRKVSVDPEQIVAEYLAGR